jgi:ABC-2 type transport system ATP-binding protein
MNRSSPIAIHTQGLTRTFGNVHAVDDLSLEIPAGSVFGFLGRNGAGKTTTIRLLLGLLEPTAGQAQVLGFDIHRQADKIREQTGALLEHNGLYERLNAIDNLEFYGRIYGLPANERQARIKELLTHLELWERRKEMVRDWSKGMRQKLAVARALLHRPPLIFLDEPTAGLDPVASVALRNDITRLVEHEGMTVFLTTHNLAEAEKMCNQVGIIRDGKLLTMGSPHELRSRVDQSRFEVYGQGFTENALETLSRNPQIATVEQTNSHLTIGLHHEMNANELVHLLDGLDVEIHEIRKGRASLEDVFLQLMEEDN